WLESSRRCSVGGPSSELFGSLELELLLGSVLARRSDGFLVSFESVRRRLFSIRARRALMSSNSEVVTVYSSLAGRMRAISSWECRIRSGVWGWSLKALATKPGL